MVIENKIINNKTYHTLVVETDFFKEIFRNKPERFYLLGKDWSSNEKEGTRIKDGAKGIEYKAFSSGMEKRLWVYEDGSFLED